MAPEFSATGVARKPLAGRPLDRAWRILAVGVAVAVAVGSGFGADAQTNKEPANGKPAGKAAAAAGAPPAIAAAPGALRARAVEAYQGARYGEALDFARAAARAGDADSATLAGHILLTAPGIAHDEAQAAQWLRQGAAAGQTDAMIELAELARRGANSARRSEARQFYEAAIARGRADAAIALGVMLAKGEDAPADLKAAAQAFERAAGLGDAQGAYLAATLYAENPPYSPEAAKARTLMRLAAERGVVQAPADYAHMLLAGYGGAEDLRQALVWLRTGAERNDPQAQFLLAAALAAGKDSSLAADIAFEEAYRLVLDSLRQPVGADSAIGPQREALKAALEQKLAPEKSAQIRRESALPTPRKPDPAKNETTVRPPLSPPKP